MPSRRTVAAAALALAAATALVVVVLLARDRGTGALPGRLVDGSLPLVEPDGLPRGVRGVARVRRAEDVDRKRLRACLRLVDVARLPARTLVVERIGVDGRSLTFRDPRAPRLYACDASARAVEPRGGWCGAVAGALRGGRLRDARLDVASCRDASGDPVAFAWLELPRKAEWLALERDSAREYYRAAGSLPVRVASSEALTGPSAAAFAVTVYSGGRPSGERRTVRARVAG